MKLFKLYVFFKKDYFIESSYKMAFLLGILSAFFPILRMFFVGKMITGETSQASLEGVDYFSFIVTGLVFSGYFQFALGIFSSSIRRAQTSGCLEAILSSQTSPKEMVVFSSIFGFVSSTLNVVMMIVWSMLLGFDLSMINILSFTVVFFLSVILFIGIGILSASSIIIFKQGNPLEFVFGTLSSLFGGVIFPVTLLPDWLQKFSNFIPLKYVLDAIRLTLLKNSSLNSIKDVVLNIVLITLIIFPVGLFAFQNAVEKGKRDGTIIQY